MMKAKRLNGPAAKLLCVFAFLMTVSLSSLAAEIPDSVKETIRNRVESGLTAGIVVGFFDPDGVTYFGHGRTGLPDQGAPDEHTVFEIGSISKVFTGTLLADMVLRGEVKLDDPIEKYLPDGVTAPRYKGVSITLGSLSDHTSGLPRMPENTSDKDAVNPVADYTDELLYEALSDIELTRAIGEQYEYSNLGAGLLGHLLELKSGRPYEQLVIERISNVLGMPDTRIEPTGSMAKRFAEGHKGGEPVPHTVVPVLAGAGALRSTAADMVVFLQANAGLTDSPLRAAMDMSHRPRVEAGSSTGHNGLGWHITTGESGREIVWHNGVTEGFTTFAGFEQASQTGVVVLTNSAGEGDDDIGLHLLDPNNRLVERELHTETDAEIAEDVLSSYVGKYSFEASPDTILAVQLQDGLLTIQVAWQPRYSIYPKSSTEFFMKEAAVTITFQSDEDGAVTGLILRQGAYENPATKVE